MIYDDAKIEYLIDNTRRLIREELDDRGLTQKNLAELSGISVRGIQDFLNGERSLRLKNFIKVCNALKLRPSQILSEAEDEFSNEL